MVTNSMNDKCKGTCFLKVDEDRKAIVVSIVGYPDLNGFLEAIKRSEIEIKNRSFKKVFVNLLRLHFLPSYDEIEIIYKNLSKLIGNKTVKIAAFTQDEKHFSNNYIIECMLRKEGQYYRVFRTEEEAWDWLLTDV